MLVYPSEAEEEIDEVPAVLYDFSGEIIQGDNIEGRNPARYCPGEWQYMHISITISLFIYLFIYLSIYLFVCLFVRLIVFFYLFVIYWLITRFFVALASSNYKKVTYQRFGFLLLLLCHTLKFASNLLKRTDGQPISTFLIYRVNCIGWQSLYHLVSTLFDRTLTYQFWLDKTWTKIRNIWAAILANLRNVSNFIASCCWFCRRFLWNKLKNISSSAIGSFS